MGEDGAAPWPVPGPFFAGGTARGCCDAHRGQGRGTSVLNGTAWGRRGRWDLAATPDALPVPRERDAEMGSMSTSTSRDSGSPHPGAGAPAVHRASHRAPSPGTSSLLSPCGSREQTLGPGRSNTLPIAPRLVAVARGALEVPGVTLGRLPGTGGKDRSLDSPPLLLCKLFAKAFISAAKPPCARVIVATPSHRTGPSVASRHAARFLRRPLRKAPLYPRFGGFLFFFLAIPGRPVPGRYTFTKALSCARSLPLPPGPCADAPRDGLRGWRGVQYPKLPAPARGFGSAGGQRSGSCPRSLPRSGSEPCVRGWQGSSPPCTVLLSPGHLQG